MATQATVSLVVDESGAIPGLTRFQQRAMQSFQGARTSAVGLNEAILKLSASIDGMGAAGTRAGDSMSRGFQKANGHALSNLDSVRLMRDDLGVRVPRAMEKLIASTEAFQAVASVAFGAFAFVGVVELLDVIGEKIRGWAHDLMGDTKAVQELHKALVEANDQEIINPKNTAVAQKSIAMLNEEITRLEARKTEGNFAGFIDRQLFTKDNQTDAMKGFSKEDEANLVKYYGMRDKLLLANGEIGTKLNAEEIHQTRETIEIGLEGYRKIAQARANAHAEIADRVNGTNGATRNLTPEQGAEEDRLADQKAAADYRALSIQYAEELRNAWQASAISRLRGEERAYAESAVAMQNYVEKAKREGQSQAQIDAVLTSMSEKYLNEKSARQEQFAAETARLAQQVQIVQSTGTQRMLAEETAALNQLAQERKESGRLASEYDEEYEDRRKAIHAKTEAEIAQSVKTYGESEVAMRDELNSSASRGYAQIAAEKVKRDDEALHKYQEMTDGLEKTDQIYIEATAVYQRELQDIDDATEEKRKLLHQRNADEIAAIEGEAQSVHSGMHQKGLLGIFADEQQQTAKINAEYSKRALEAQAANDHTIQGEEDTQAKIGALNDLRNAQMNEQANSMSEKLASAIESGFRDPMGSIKDAMQHEMAQIIANWIMQLTVFKRLQGAILGGSGAQGAPGGVASMGTAAVGSGGLLSSLFHGTASTRSSAGGSYSGDSYSGYGSSSYGGSYSGPSTGANSYSSSGGSSIGSTVSSAASDIPTISHNVSAARAQSQGYSPIGARVPTSANTGVDAAGMHDEGGNEAGGVAETTSAPKGSTVANDAAGAAVVGMAGYEGYQSTKDDFKSGTVGGMMKGTLGDAMSGMAIGAMFGPEGALIGAGVGAAVGLVTGAVGMMMGEGGRLAARDYYKKSIFPEIEKDRNGYQGGDFQSAISDVNKTASDGLTYMRSHWGGSSADWVNQNYLRKEQVLAVGEIEARAKGGSQYISMSAKQFHTGTSGITDFGDLATSSNEGFIHALLGEAIVNPVASSTHAAALSAMNNGASPADIATMYQSAGGNSASSGDTHHHYNISAIDAKGFDSFLRNGGARQIVKHVNNFASQYAGDGISG